MKFFIKENPMNAQEIKQLAYSCGADLCGITTLDRFEGAPPQMDPRFIMPDAKSMIVMGFRVMRGSLRGIEEGTFFSNYSAMGYGGLTYNFIPMTVTRQFPSVTRVTGAESTTTEISVRDTHAQLKKENPSLTSCFTFAYVPIWQVLAK